MTLSVALLVLLAALLHAGWNALLKLGNDRLLTMTLIIGVGGAAALPLLPFLPFPAGASWPFLLLSAALHLGYFFFLIKAYRDGDLGHVYPVARGIAPLLVAGGAAVLAGENLPPLGVCGIVLASAGIGSLAFLGGKGTAGSAGKAYLYALATGAFIAAYTLSDGFGVRRSGGVLGYIAWLFFISAVALTIAALLARRGALASYTRRYWRPGLAGGAMCAVAYGSVIWALGEAPMAFVSALRETSVIFAALFSALLLKEAFGVGRLLAAVTVAAGVALLHLAA